MIKYKESHRDLEITIFLCHPPRQVSSTSRCKIGTSPVVSVFLDDPFHKEVKAVYHC